MPFIRGGELFEHLSRETNLEEDRAKFIVIQVALALGHLHTKNIVYRDLKPENVMIEQSGYIKLIDFNISKQLQPNQRTNSICGTYEYFAPEIVK